MVRLDATHLRYMTRQDFRVLTAVEMGMRNHEVVPTELIVRIAALRNTNTLNIIGQLAKYSLIKHVNTTYDGYKLTYQGYDYLALKAFVSKGLIKGVGRRIGVGKESDVYEVQSNEDEVMVMKVHRLGRVCFRTVKEKRDYLLHRKNASFMYLSRLAAVREFAYLKALYDEGFPTPIPYEINRHCILMSKVNAYPLCDMNVLNNPEKVYNTLMNLLVRFAQVGLIHGDFNEFNLLIDSKENITVIDFPQMISVNHPNAKEMFERDAHCIRRFFVRKLGYEFHDVPEFVVDTPKTGNLDQALKASGAAKGAFRKSEDDIEERVLAGLRELKEMGSDEDDEDEEIENGDEDFILYDDDDEEEEDDEGLEDEDEELEPNALRSMRSRKARNLEKYGNTRWNSNRMKSNLDYVEDEDEDEEDKEDNALLLSAKQLEGLTLASDDEEETGIYGNLAAYELSDDEDNEDEDEEEETTHHKQRGGRNKPIGEVPSMVRKKKKKTGLADSQIRQKLQAAKRTKQIKGNFKANVNKVRDRKMKQAIKEAKAAL